MLVPKPDRLMLQTFLTRYNIYNFYIFALKYFHCLFIFQEIIQQRGSRMIKTNLITFLYLNPSKYALVL